jgi:hypothetical protein
MSTKLLVLTVLAACASDDMTQTPAPADFGGGKGTDAFGARPVDAARIASLRAQAKDLIKPGSELQIESRLGVPTFLWAKPPLVAASRARWVAQGVTRPEVAAARAAVSAYALRRRVRRARGQRADLELRSRWSRERQHQGPGAGHRDV